MTKSIMDAEIRRRNAQNTIHELFSYNVIPIVNENDTIATDEIEVYDEFGDNDTLSALVAELVGADILILLSDIDGLYTSDPNTDPDAKLIYYVDEITPDIEKMASGAVTKVGTGGMRTKLRAAQIASDAGIDMIIANASPLDNIGKIMDGEEIGTFFKARGK
ncbi:MAG: glutamate 5-kinase [Clostridia bacterium]